MRSATWCGWKAVRLQLPPAPLPRRIARALPALLGGIGLGTLLHANEGLAWMFCGGLVFGLIALHIVERDRG